jgi:hypothetical protein
MHTATQEVERRVAEILKKNPDYYGRRVVLKEVQAQMQIELLHDISAKLECTHPPEHHRQIQRKERVTR